MKTSLLAITVIILLVISLLSCASFGYSAKGKRLERMKKSSNFENGTFKNEIKTEQMVGSYWKMTKEFFFGGSKRSKPETAPEIVPQTKTNFEQVPNSGLRLTWLGHSTMILEQDGSRILIDPVFSDRTSPFQWIGSKRFHDVPVTIEDLPELDAVVISHDHYDHLDYHSILKLKDKVKTFLVPLGVGAHLVGWGVNETQIVELDWWEEHKIKEIRYIATPARHFSGRGLTDRNSTLWASWTFIGPQHKVFYSGDTGPMPMFDDIGKKFGGFDLTMIQLGAYDKMWPFIHMNPDEAIKAHQQLKGNYMLPVHWGTFDLALHAWDEPILETIRVAKEHNVNLLQPKPGEMVDIKVSEPQSFVVEK